MIIRDKLDSFKKKYAEVTYMNKEGKPLYFLAMSVKYVGFTCTWEEEIFNTLWMNTVGLS